MTEQEKYLICPVCFSLYLLDNPKEDDTLDCEHCEEMEVSPLEDFIYFSCVEGLEELKDEFSRSRHLDGDLKEFIVSNIKILIQLLKEFENE